MHFLQHARSELERMAYSDYYFDRYVVMCIALFACYQGPTSYDAGGVLSMTCTPYYVMFCCAGGWGPVYILCTIPSVHQRLCNIRLCLQETYLLAQALACECAYTDIQPVLAQIIV